MLRFSSDRCRSVLRRAAGPLLCGRQLAGSQSVSCYGLWGIAFRRSFAGSPGCCCMAVSSLVRGLWVSRSVGYFVPQPPLVASPGGLFPQPLRFLGREWFPLPRDRFVLSAPFSGGFACRVSVADFRDSAARTRSFDRSGPAVLFPAGRPGASPERFVSKPSVPAIPAAPVAVVPAAGRRHVPTINGLQPNLQPLSASLPSASPAGFRAASG